MAKQKDNQGRKKRGVFGWILLILFTIFLIGVLAFGIFCFYFYSWAKADLTKQTYLRLEDYNLDQTSVIYYEDKESGEWKELQKLYATENRIWTDYEKIPKDLVFACIAIEDKRFFEHDGVDWLRTVKACGNMFIGRGSFGGSTLTQQLVKNLTQEDEVTVRRKITEIYRALQLEVDYEKEDIMEMYLNTIYLGEGCYGVESASLMYFGKNVWELSLAECASLIGITNNPSAYDPYIYPENNRYRQETILEQMLEQGYITQEEHDEAVDQELVFESASNSAYENQYGYYSYFVDQVVRDVTRDLMEQTGYSYDVASDMLTSGGYKIYCTVDLDVQTELERSFENLDNMPDTESSQQLQGSMVIIDNETGDCVGIIGGTGPKTGTLTLNRATQSTLQPGSVIKPLTVFAPALESGLITPYSVMDDTPTRFVDGGATWPLNADRIYRGLVDMRTAMGLSLNTIAVKLVGEMDAKNCYEFARDRFGITTLVEQRDDFTDLTTWGMGLGSLTDGVQLYSIAEAYAAIYNHGVYREARTYTRVENNAGEVILSNEQDTHQAVSETTAYYLNDMMQVTVTEGTGTDAALTNQIVAGKTGTTSDDFDRWFAGYTPYYTAVTWTGYDTPESIVTTDGSGSPATALWQGVMEGIHTDLAPAEFWKPGNIVECTFCCDSGHLMSEACEADPRGGRAVTGYLALEDVPKTECGTHMLIEVCGQTGQVATDFCRQQAGSEIQKIGMIHVERYFPLEGIEVLDQEFNFVGEVPAGYYPAGAASEGNGNQDCYLHVERVEVTTLEEMIEEALEEARKEREEQKRKEEEAQQQAQQQLQPAPASLEPETPAE